MGTARDIVQRLWEHVDDRFDVLEQRLDELAVMQDNDRVALRPLVGGNPNLESPVKLNQRIAELEELVDQLRTVLRKVEWHWDYVARIDECPICDNTQERGHEVDCTLDILLKGGER